MELLKEIFTYFLSALVVYFAGVISFAYRIFFVDKRKPNDYDAFLSEFHKKIFNISFKEAITLFER